MKKEEAVKKLQEFGHTVESERLKDWRDKNEHNWGWDGHLKGAHPDLAKEIGLA